MRPPPGSQVFCRNPATSDVVGSHGAVNLVVAPASPGHQRAIAFCHAFDDVELIRLADQQHAIDHARAGHPLQPVAGPVRDHAAEHQVVPVLGQFVCKMAKEREEERIGNLLALFVTERNDHPDHTRTTRPQLARHLVGPEAVLTGKSLNAFARFGVDERLPGQCARHGSCRDTGQSGEVGKRAHFHRRTRTIRIAVVSVPVFYPRCHRFVLNSLNRRAEVSCAVSYQTVRVGLRPLPEGL